MLKLDNNLLNELGLGSLPEEQKRSMLQHIYETLELRVGTQLANQMTDAQLEEFEKFVDAGGDNNQAEALKWLETNLPNYKQVVQEVFETLKREISQMAPQIMASSSPSPQASVQPAPPSAQHVSQQMPPTGQPMQPVQSPYQPASHQPLPQQPAYQQPVPPAPVQQPDPTMMVSPQPTVAPPSSMSWQQHPSQPIQQQANAHQGQAYDSQNMAGSPPQAMPSQPVDDGSNQPPLAV